MPKRRSKTSKRSKQQEPKNTFKLATVLLVAGISLVLTALLISVLFIQGTGFKAKYQQKQYDQCVDRGTSRQECREKFL